MERALGPEHGTLTVNTYREGVAQRVGHDLVLAVTAWEATLELGPARSISAARLVADPASLQVREGRNGVKPLTDRDRREIRETIRRKTLRGGPIEFASTSVEPRDGGVSVRGELTIAGTTRPVAFDLDVAGGCLVARVAVRQSEWGIQPYRAFMGALRVRDTLEVRLEARLWPAVDM